jgi:hypothetical protein
MYLQGIDNSNIYNNLLYNNIDWTGNSCEEYGIGLSSCNTSNFYGNRIYNGHYKAIHLYGDNTVEYGPSRGNNFYLNHIYGYTGAIDRGGLVFGSVADTNSIQNNNVYYNIFDNNSSHLVSSNGGTGNVAYNNVFRNATGSYSFVIPDNTTDGWTLKNNIFYQNIPGDGYFIGAIHISSGLTTSNNLYYATPGTWYPIYHNATFYYVTDDPSHSIAIYEPTSINADPKFISSSDFHLQPTSPAINAGGGVGLTTDYDGKTVPRGPKPDIGVYEFAGDTPVPPFSGSSGGGGGCSISHEGKSIGDSPLGTLLALISPGIWMVGRKARRKIQIVDRGL